MPTPGVHAKGIKEVVLLSKRTQTARLDVWPFFLLYLAVACKAVYHISKFEWHALTLSSYAMGVSSLLHVLAFLFTHWSTRFKAWVSCVRTTSIDNAELVLVVPDKFQGEMEIVKLERRSLREGLISTEELGFEFRRQRFVYHEEQNVFEKLKFPVKEPFEFYLKATGHGTEAKALAAHDKYGLNKVDVPLPAFASLLKDHLLAPFFVFQVFCVFLWMLDEYWYYSLFTLFMLVTFECTVVQQRLRNLTELRTLQTPKQHTQVYRCGKWELLPGDALFPGDIISIGRPSGGAVNEDKVVPADCLLLAGTCIAEEAVLTGESTPQWKVPAAELDPNAHLNMKLDKNHILFGGTKLLQHTGDRNARVRTPDGGCLAYVLRTGFETSQGRLMRTILFSTERVTANSLEAGVFILFLLIFAIAAAWHVLSNGLLDPERDRFKLILNCVMIITSVIPPELPMELSMAVNASLVALARKRVFCTEPFRIPYAGKVEVCCFDKTGTLTSDHLLLEEVVVNSEAERPVAQRVMATCHSLVQVSASEAEIIGDPLEKAALEASEWSYAPETARSPDRSVSASILHRHHFNSNLKRMSCLVRVEDAAARQPFYEAVMKGAPEVVKKLLVNPPADYDKTYKGYAAQGARVIALARRALGSDTEVDLGALRGMAREEFESKMTFAGFAVFSCPLKEDSEPALRQLRESSHQLVMITGDAPLTACFAASKVHIVTRDVLVLGHKHEEKGQVVHGLAKGKAVVAESDSDYVWSSPDEATQIPFSRVFKDMVDVASKYDLAVTGDALAYVESLGLAGQLIPLCQVFARVSPEQKELVLVTLRGLGLTTLMCGDGTNDVGGLKAAHVGVALLSASEAAIKAAKEKKKKEGKKGDKDKDKDKALAAGGTSGELAESKDGKKDGKKKQGPGQEMLEKMRAANRPITPAMQKMADWMDAQQAEGAAGDPPMLKPGDASMASPFTAKAISVMPCTDIIKQGRCTLVTTVQMFKILGLLCLSTAYALSVMYLQGVKMSDAQATLNGMLTAALFFFISQAKPLDKLSPVRPHPSIFSPYFFISLLGQFAVHLALLVYMYHLALAETPEGERLKPDSEFKPNLVNSVTYMVEAVVQLSTFTVNYMGHPFNNSISENKVMFNVLKYMAVFLFVVLYDLVPGLGELFGMVPIPNHIRFQLVVLAVGAVGFNYFLEHSMRAVFPARVPPEKGYMLYVNGKTQPPPVTKPLAAKKND